MNFELVSKFKPTGDQPQAIKQIVEGLRQDIPYQTLLGVTVREKPLLWQTS